ncbi:MAG: toll/interleukin-1 receptor domain-containing protein [Gammaproteobacteria bacterium]|nr:toll/interleukin-1 receptor domain-containing protein [Gammaproteobacteria bacterium]
MDSKTTDRVFLSYAREDSGFSLALANEIKQKGVNIWVDQWDIAAGADWDQSIDEALYSCDTLVLVLSPDSVASSEVRSELRVALSEKKTIIPVLYRECRKPRQLLLIQHVDFTKGDPADATAIGQLLGVIDAVIEADSTAEDSVEQVHPSTEKVSVEAPSPRTTDSKSNTIVKQFKNVMHWKDFLGFNQAVGTFTVYNDRFEFRSSKRSFDIYFSNILKISEGSVTLSIRTAEKTIQFSSDTFTDLSMSSISEELQSYMGTSS